MPATLLVKQSDGAQHEMHTMHMVIPFFVLGSHFGCEGVGMFADPRGRTYHIACSSYDTCVPPEINIEPIMRTVVIRVPALVTGMRIA